MMEIYENHREIEYSFLSKHFPKTHSEALKFKKLALIYAMVLTAVFILSQFFYSSILEWFIRLMMGCTILNIVFIGVMIAVLDIPVKSITIEEIAESKIPLRYTASVVWGCFLCIAGITFLYLSSQYKEDYVFKCSDFYLEESTGIYHIWEDCKYIGVNKDNDYIENKDGYWVKGYELEQGHTICDACKEIAEDAEDDMYLKYR